MKLKAYLESKKITPYAFAKQIGVSHQLVRLWVANKSIPRPHNMALLAEQTGGRVRAKDFYENAA